MLELTVISLRGHPPPQGASATFGPAGGTIGRAAGNTLVLDDPDRTVSRTHATVHCRDGRYVVVDQGSNPLQHNGRALGNGNAAPLADGDRLVIGGFELRVVVHATQAQGEAWPAGEASEDDPFAGLLSGLGAVPAPAPSSSAPPAPSASPRPLAGIPDPFAVDDASGPTGAAAIDPFADLLGPAPPPPPAAARLDDFSDLGLGASGPVPSIDDLFGPGPAHTSPGSDPFAGSPLADPLLQPNTAGALDPLAALQGAPAASAASRADHLPIGNFGFTPPLAVPAMAPAAAPPMPVVPPAMAAPPMATPASATALATDAELLAAFLRGLQGTHQPPQALTPALMERIGVLLRSATEGTLQLLLARQELKREVRAEVTMIAPQANNPLKFSPTADVALAHLLGPPLRGFMPAEAAMRDAYDDLRAHQFGVMVGMRAALAHVIARFEPAELEKKIAARSALGSLFAANRKARLWDEFIALYGGIASEAEDDFHSLFGKAFLQAYEAQMQRFKSGG